MADEAPGGSPDQPAQLPPAPRSPAAGPSEPLSSAPASLRSPAPVSSASAAPPPADVMPPQPGAVPAPPNGRRTGWRRWVQLGGVIGFIAVCSIVMLLILGFSNGVAGLIIGLVAAIPPGAVLW